LSLNQTKVHYFSPNAGVIALDALSNCRYLDPNRIYSRSKSKVVRHVGQFKTFFVPRFFWGEGPQIFGSSVFWLDIFPIMWQSFHADRPREILRESSDGQKL